MKKIIFALSLLIASHLQAGIIVYDFRNVNVQNFLKSPAWFVNDLTPLSVIDGITPIFPLNKNVQCFEKIKKIMSDCDENLMPSIIQFHIEANYQLEHIQSNGNLGTLAYIDALYVTFTSKYDAKYNYVCSIDIEDDEKDVTVKEY